MDATTTVLSRFAADLREQDIPGQALHAAKRSLVDSMGCALGAFSADPVRIARRLARRQTSSTPATLLGTRSTTTPEMAAFVNGIMVRYLDFSDDYIHHDGPHPSDNIPAILAMGEATSSTGRQVATAIVLAYEVVAQLVDNAAFKAGGWDYVTETSIATALAAGHLLALDEATMGHALGLAVAPNIALRQTRAGELSMWKGCAGPNGARNGLFAALLASEGMTGPDEIFEGTYGLWAQVTGPFSLEAFGAAQHYKVEKTFFKSMPVMYTSKAPIEAAFAARPTADLERVTGIVIEVDAFALSTGDGPKKYDPHTRETADHSTPYLVVAALVFGEISPRVFTPECFRDREILDLLAKVEMREDESFTARWPEVFQCRLTLVHDSGDPQVVHLQDPKGHPRNPMNDDKLVEKFLRLTEPVLAPVQAQHALDLMWNLEELDAVDDLLTSMVVEGER